MHEENNITNHARRPDWEKWGVIVGVVGLLLTAMGMALPGVIGVLSHAKGGGAALDGPLAQIAISQKGYDQRGFSQEALTSTASSVLYRYSGHYQATNNTNSICTITLYANPAKGLPFGGASGFVYIQRANSTYTTDKVLHNPTVHEIWETKVTYGEGSPECYADNMTYPLQ